MLTDARTMNIDELKAFLACSDVLHSREETYAWIERTLVSYGYLSRTRAGSTLTNGIVPLPSTRAKIAAVSRGRRCPRAALW